MKPYRTTPTIAEDVAGRVRRLIHAGELGAGDRLPAERELAIEFGVARVSVREAIRQLSEGGYVSVRRGARGGTFISALEGPYQSWLEQMRARAGELDAILDLRIAVEGHAAYLAAQRHTKGQLRQMNNSLDEMTRSNDRATFRSSDSQFHTGLAAAARSPRLEVTIAHVRGEFFIPTDTLIFHELIEASVNGHAAILDAVRRHNAHEARAAMTDHIEDTRTHMHQVLRGKPLTGSRKSTELPT